MILLAFLKPHKLQFVLLRFKSFEMWLEATYLAAEAFTSSWKFESEKWKVKVKLLSRVRLFATP